MVPSTCTQCCVTYVSRKCLSQALPGVSLAQLAVGWDRQGKHWLSPEQRLFDTFMHDCHTALFLPPRSNPDSLTCLPLALFS